MPELRVKDLRPPELQLPEVTREDLARLVSGIGLPAVDLPSADDLAKSVQGAAAAVLPGRRRRRRWPLVVGGLIVAGLGSRLVLGDDAVRARLARVIKAIRARFQALRTAEFERHEPEGAIAFPAAATAPIEESRFADGSGTDAPDYPRGLGSKNEESRDAGRSNLPGT